MSAVIKSRMGKMPAGLYTFTHSRVLNKNFKSLLIFVSIRLESNDVLRLKFQKLQGTIVNNVHPAVIIDFLFEKAVINAADEGTAEVQRRPKTSVQRFCSTRQNIRRLLHSCTLPSNTSGISTFWLNKSTASPIII